MAFFLSSVISFIVGAGVSLLFVKSSKLGSKKGISQLQSEHQKEVNQLEFDKLNLKNRNGDLVQIISQNQRSIKENQRDIKELSEAVAILSDQVITCQELLGSVTKIREAEDMNAQIVITKRFHKKYERFLNSDTYTSD
jgi:hypothetical protein